MGLSGAISLGPVQLPVWLLLAAACVVLALLVARFPFRRHAHVRSRSTAFLTNALAAFIVAWKLTPSLLHPRALILDPVSQLLASPGVPGIVVGGACAALSCGVWLWRHRRLRRAALLSLGLFAGTLGTTVSVSALALAVFRPVRVAPEFTLSSLSGHAVSLAALRGKVVVLNFWATWCAPCRAELPELRSFAEEPGAEGVVLLAVNLTATERSIADVDALVESRDMSFPVLLDRDGAVATAYGIEVIPTTVIVGPDGGITAERSGAVDAGWLRRESRRAWSRSARAGP